MTTDKPVLTKEQAEAFNYARNKFGISDKLANCRLIRDRINREQWMAYECPCIFTIREQDFIYALHYGYDVEKDKYDELRDYHNRCDASRIFTENGYSRACNIGRIQGIEDTLDKLGITVKGINGEEDTE